MTLFYDDDETDHTRRHHPHTTTLAAFGTGIGDGYTRRHVVIIMGGSAPLADATRRYRRHFTATNMSQHVTRRPLLALSVTLVTRRHCRRYDSGACRHGDAARAT